MTFNFHRGASTSKYCIKIKQTNKQQQNFWENSEENCQQYKIKPTNWVATLDLNNSFKGFKILNTFFEFIARVHIYKSMDN